MIHTLAIYLALIGSFFGAFGLLTLKLGLRKGSLRHLVLPGLAFLIGLVFGISALKYGELSVVYPITALSYVWTRILSKNVLNEKVVKKELIGILLIMLGVDLIVR